MTYDLIVIGAGPGRNVRAICATLHSDCLGRAGNRGEEVHQQSEAKGRGGI